MSDVSKHFPGARVTFFGNILYCSHYRTFDENVFACMQALSLLTGMSITELSQSEEIKVEAFRSS